MTQQRSDPGEVARGLSKAQREWVLHGPYRHWTQTTRALAKKGIAPLVGIRGINEFGAAVRACLMEDERG